MASKYQRKTKIQPVVVERKRTATTGTKRGPAGNRTRPYVIRKDDVPDVIRELRVFVYETCLDMGVCPNCMSDILHYDRKTKKTYAKCASCLEWHREYSRQRTNAKGEHRG